MASRTGVVIFPSVLSSGKTALLCTVLSSRTHTMRRVLNCLSVGGGERGKNSEGTRKPEWLGQLVLFGLERSLRRDLSSL